MAKPRRKYSKKEKAEIEKRAAIEFSQTLREIEAQKAQEQERLAAGETQENVFPADADNPPEVLETHRDGFNTEYPPAQVAEDARQMARTKTALATFTTDELIAEVASRTNKIALDRETLVRWANALDRNRWTIVDAVRREILRVVYPRAEVE